MTLAEVERHERPGSALDCRTRALRQDPAGEILDHGPLANAVIGSDSPARKSRTPSRHSCEGNRRRGFWLPIEGTCGASGPGACSPRLLQGEA